jgi:hypothetical protein
LTRFRAEQNHGFTEKYAPERLSADLGGGRRDVPVISQEAISSFFFAAPRGKMGAMKKFQSEQYTFQLERQLSDRS